MAATVNILLQLALMAFIPLCYSRPPGFDSDDDLAYFLEQDSPRRYFMEVPYEAILSSQRAHAQGSHLPNGLVDKRAAAASEVLGSLLPKMDDDTDIRGMKRKMFWQPLGYLPASVRAHNNPSGSTGSETQGSSSNVFRYG